MHDLRAAFRSLAASCTFTIAAVLTLALGIGASAAIFAVVDAVLLRPLPYPEPQRLVRIETIPGTFVKFTLSGFEIWPPELATDPVFAGVGLYSEGGLNLGEPAVRIRAAAVTPGFFTALGVAPVLGRVFTADDVRETRHLVVVSDSFWRSRLAGDRSVVGSTLRLNGRPYTIVGVLPPRVDFPEAAALWIPTGPDPQLEAVGTQPKVVARLAPGHDAAGAQATMLGFLEPEARAFHGPRVRVMPLHDFLVSGVRPLLTLVGAAVVLVLLVVGSNVASLLLARLDARAREFAVRHVLGASRGRIGRQLLAEGLLLCAIAGGLAVPAAAWTLAGLRALVPETLHGAADLAVNGRVLGTIAGLCLLATAALGLAPLLVVEGRSATAALRTGTLSTAGSSWRRFRSGLVVGQVAAALLLLSLAATVTRAVTELMQVDLGASGRGALTFEVTVPRPFSEREWRQDGDRAGAFAQRALRELPSLPGVDAVAAADLLPAVPFGIGTSAVPATIERSERGGAPYAVHVFASGGYFEALGIDRLAGRTFVEADATGPPVVIVSERVVSTAGLTPDEAVGRRANVNGFPNGPPIWAEIVGVVRDVRFYGPQSSPHPAAYEPLRSDSAFGSLFVVVRGKGDPRALGPAVRATVARIDPAVPVYNLRTFDDIRADYLTRQRFARLVMGAFGALTVLLATLGLYALVSYLVQLRTREIGVRMALGAAPGRIRREVLARGVMHGAFGIAVGVVATIGIWRLAAARFEGFGRLEPVGMGLVAAGVLALAAAAAWLPAERATRVDPAVTLRAE